MWTTYAAPVMCLFHYEAMFLLKTMSDYNLHGNFGRKFPSNGTGIFFGTKNRTGLSCTIYNIRVNFSLSLDMKPGTSNPTNGTEHFGKNGGKVIPRKVLLFFRTISTRMNHSI